MCSAPSAVFLCHLYVAVVASKTGSYNYKETMYCGPIVKRVRVLFCYIFHTVLQSPRIISDYTLNTLVCVSHFLKFSVSQSGDPVHM